MMRLLKYLFGKKSDEFLEDMSDKYLIAGLGNPGRKYQHNRHNIGFMVIDALAETHGLTKVTSQNKAIIRTGRIKGQAVILAKPQTYMNNSGDAVGPLANYYKVPTERVLVVYDELDIPFGTLRVRGKGGAGGHNGMKSIINHLGQEFPRMRVGIGRPPGRMPASAHVLQDFGKSEQETLTALIDETVRAIETFLTDGVELSMTRHNGSVQ